MLITSFECQNLKADMPMGMGKGVYILEVVRLLSVEVGFFLIT